MKSYIPLLEASPLFLGIKSANIETLLTCLGCYVLSKGRLYLFGKRVN